MCVVLFAVMMTAASGILRVAIDETATVDREAPPELWKKLGGDHIATAPGPALGQAAVPAVAPGAATPGVEIRRGLLARLLNKVICSGNCSRSVCPSAKATGNYSSSTALARFEYKKDKLHKLAKYLSKKKCIMRFVGGFGEFRGNILPRSCAAHWAEFDQRLFAFDSCGEVAKDGLSSLSQAVWGLGDAAFQAAHSSLATFINDILLLLNMAYNGNEDIKSMLEEGGCELNLNIIPDQLEAAMERHQRVPSVPLDQNLATLDAAIFGPTCDFELAQMPWVYLKWRLLRSIRAMVHGTAETFLLGEDVVSTDLLTKGMDEGSSSDDPEVAAAEAKLRGEGGSSLVQMEHEPITTSVVVTVSTGVIVAALAGGAAILAITAMVLRSMMMTRRIKTRGGI